MSDPTAMLEVEAGNKTGIYYVTVSNLPFNTQWTELKDFVRTVCEVDYVEVFNASTHAWVRVLGYQDYCKAFQLLNGGVFKGRHLVADCRNANERISIRMLVDVGQPPLPRQAPSSSVPAAAGYISGRGNAEGYYKPLGAVMDGLGLDNYSYGYAGYSCGYAGGRYWPGQGYEGSAEPQSRRGHESKKKKKEKGRREDKDKGKDKDKDKDKDKGKGKEREREKGPVVPVIVDGSSNRRDKKTDKKKRH